MSPCQVCGDPRGGRSWHPCLHWLPRRGYTRAPHTGLCAICLCSQANGWHWCIDANRWELTLTLDAASRAR